MYAVTDGYSGSSGGFRTPGTGHNFLVHNMCRLPDADGTWMMVEGGMGTVTRMLAEAAQQAGVRIETNAKVQEVELSGNAGLPASIWSTGEALRAARSSSMPIPSACETWWER